MHIPHCLPLAHTICPHETFFINHPNLNQTPHFRHQRGTLLLPGSRHIHEPRQGTELVTRHPIRQHLERFARSKQLLPPKLETHKNQLSYINSAKHNKHLIATKNSTLKEQSGERTNSLNQTMPWLFKANFKREYFFSGKSVWVYAKLGNTRSATSRSRNSIRIAAASLSTMISDG
mmetsp:Transcript_15626/g.27243  ORF Transcript_15626/g.27243 Transcript_15626/m.27243 type:complete len:176 (-) Transcript_15626:1360-1887(-)